MAETTRTERLTELGRAHMERGKKYTPREEDYLEVIYELIKAKGYARAIDISSHLHVRSPSVTKMLQKLHASGLLMYERYRGIMLTTAGESLAKSVRERHGMLVRLLMALGVDEATAHKDAEGIEHNLHRQTIGQLSKLLKFIQEHPQALHSLG